MPIKIATWNVNSLRVRLPHLLQWLAQTQPDIIALQETKLIDEDFPLSEITAAGYHAVFSGQKTYNGVAVLSRQPLSGVITTVPNFSDPQRRVLVAHLDDLCIVNLYVPNGSSVDSEKYQYKLAWLEQVTGFVQNLLRQRQKVVVLGDFNIAPDNEDVYDPKVWEGQVLFSQPEREAMQRLINLGFTDAFRLFEREGGHYTWWDYRMGAFRRNHGLRIDHILLSEKMRLSCESCFIDKEVRLQERPSDHVPVIASFNS